MEALIYEAADRVAEYIGDAVSDLEFDLIVDMFVADWMTPARGGVA